MQKYIVSVSGQDIGKRLDIFLMKLSQEKNLGFSRTSIQKLIQQGKVIFKDASLINPAISATGGRCRAKKNKIRPHYKIKIGDEITICIEEKKLNTVEAEDIPLDIIYEDEDLAVINKPSGLVVHPAPGNYGHTLVNALLHSFKNLSDINPQRPGIVHRLDKDTSGLLVIAKNNSTHFALTGQFSKHTIKRKYIALVKGKMEFDENIIELPIGRHPYKRKNMSVGFGRNVRYAKTYYRTLRRFRSFSLLELEPFTGRTHQLRVHLAFLGHPILGDSKYGKNNGFERLALHAKYLGFMHPRTGKFVEFSCDLPKEFTEFINKNT